jgi:hypothetical protein
MLLPFFHASYRLLLIGLLGVSLLGCTPAQQWPQGQSWLEKFTFDLASLEDPSSSAEASGLCALSYQFCIPARPVLAEQVRKIDPSVVIFDYAPDRSRCGDETFLCIGTTHQPDYRSVLIRLAKLPYIERIDEAPSE